MKFLSVCSGIEAASVAWNPLGWEAVGFSEIEAFPCSLLSHRYPSVQNFGDLNGFSTWSFDKPDVVVGGTPCQSFSVAGLRGGMADPRGQLALVYLGLVDRVRPRWVVWENVPGVLSSGGGRDFGSFLGALSELGYGWAYRVLDAQYFGVPQRRRRVFVVGCLGDWRGAAAVLFERASLRGDLAPSREAGESTAHPVAPSIGASGRGFSRTGETRGQDPVVAHSLRADGFDASEDGTGRGTPLVAHTLNAGACNRIDAESETCIAFHSRQDPIHGDVMMPLEAKGGQAVAFQEAQTGVREYHEAGSLRANGPGHDPVGTRVRQGMSVRRLTPRECERLQGFPDDWTLVPLRKRNTKAEQRELKQYAIRTHQNPELFKWSKDGPRYKALGNSIAVPVLRWIGERIDKVSSL